MSSLQHELPRAAPKQLVPPLDQCCQGRQVALGRGVEADADADDAALAMLDMDAASAKSPRGKYEACAGFKN